MLWLQLIAGVLMFGAGVLLLARAGVVMGRASKPEQAGAGASTRPSSSRLRLPRRRRSFEDEVAELTEQLREND